MEVVMTHTSLRPLFFLPALGLLGCFAHLPSMTPQGVHSHPDDAASSDESNADAGEGMRAPSGLAKAEEGVAPMPNSVPQGMYAVGPPSHGTVGGTVYPPVLGEVMGAKGVQLGHGGLGTRGSGSAGARLTLSDSGVRQSGGASAPLMDQSSNSEEYTDHGINPFTLVTKDPLSTFSIDVDTASFTMARRKLNQGILPAWEGVRAEEFINFFDYDYVAPENEPLAVHMEAMPDPFKDGRHILRVGLQAMEYEPDERPPLHLTFLVDVSGSMSSRDKLGLAKVSMHTLVDNLGAGDTVALATYAGRVAKVLEPTEATEKTRIHAAIDALRSGGSTAMSSGIDLAYAMADEAFEEGAENRVVILSDGDANVGKSSWEAMLRQIKGFADQGITLSTIGFGQGNYRDTLMEQLANKGDGNNFYVDSQRESDRIFGEQIGGTMITVARDTKVQVEFNPAAVSSYRLIGYENRDIADADFRNDRVDAGEVGSGHSVTALYEVILGENASDGLATVRVRWEAPGADKDAEEKAFDFSASMLQQDVSSASDATKLAYGAATLAEVLRQSPHAAEVDLEALADLVDGVRGNRSARELARLIDTADELGAMDPQDDWLSQR